MLVALIGAVALLLAGCGGSGGPSGPTRTIQHAMGTTEVAAEPKRVVVLDTGELDSVLALGVTPVGTVHADVATGPPSYLGPQAAGIQQVGTIQAPNMEAIAALEPDLILSNAVRHRDSYEQLQEIAPTVFAESVGKSWQQNFLLAGDALGKRPQADQKLAEFRTKADGVGKAFGNPAQIEVSTLRFTGSEVRAYGQGSFIGTVLQEVGLGRPQVAQTDKTFAKLSPEEITKADGDLLFYAGYGDEGKSQLNGLAAGPLWQHLGAVTRKAAHPVSDDLWYLGIGPIAADKVLDELPRYAPAR